MADKIYEMEDQIDARKEQAADFDVRLEGLESTLALIKGKIKQAREKASKVLLR